MSPGWTMGFTAAAWPGPGELKDWQVEKFVPNNGPAFAKLLALVKDGDERPAPPATNQ